MRVAFVKLPLNYYERDFQMSFNGAEYEVRMYKFKNDALCSSKKIIIYFFNVVNNLIVFSNYTKSWHSGCTAYI